MKKRSLIATAAALASTAALTLLPTPAAATSPDVVLSQVYGGGGNSGATLTNDYIELYNRGAAAVDLSGWSVQYASASGTSWQATTLSGSIAAGGVYLVGEGAGAGGTTPLPTPDASGSIAMSATNGKVALVASTATLSCGAACSSAPEVRDFIGYGTANDFEGSAAAPGLSNTTADLRAVNGADTDDNAADFTKGAPDPRNSTGGGPGGGGGTPPPTSARVHDIQGAAHRSPLVGQAVTSVPGVVTAVGPRGFWMQDPQPDADPATSEGVYVFTGSAPAVAIRESVLVSGTVNEYRPGSANSLSNTEIGSPSVTVVGTGAALPAPIVIGSGGVTAPPPARSDNPGDVEAAPFDPTVNALDFYESFEGMLVSINDAQAVGPTNRYGELPVVPAGSDAVRSARGGVMYSSYADPNTERVILDSTLAPLPDENVGAIIPGLTEGVLDYDFGNYYLHVLATPTVTASAITPETTRDPGSSELTVATYNVENLAPTDAQDKFDRLAHGLVDNLRSPDIVSLEEIQDNDGAVDDGVVAANVTLDKLVAAVIAAGGPTYRYRDVDPINDTNGGQPGGNIRVAFLFRSDRGVTFIDKPGGSATSSVGVKKVRGAAHLTQSPGLIQPTNSAFDDSRKPLAGEFGFQGRKLFVIGNHFDSKGGDDPLMGRFQPIAEPSAVQRHQQASIVRDFVDKIRSIEPGAAIVVLGDLNDYEFSETADILVGDGYLTDMPRTLAPGERYTYDYEGNSEVLDHILISSVLANAPYSYDVVHINSEFANQTSDHDPQVVRFALFSSYGSHQHRHW